MAQNLFSQNLNNKRVIGYYNWDNSSYPASAIDFTNLTHICHAFLWPLADGSLDQSQLALYPDLITAAHNNGVKVLVSIGGYGTSTQNTGFKTMVNSTAARAAFITNLVNFIKANGYDGADFDWEYPASGDKANFTALLTDLRTAFNSNNIPLMTAAVYNSPSAGYDVPKLNTLLDWIGIMTYDFTGSWEQPGTRLINNSALYSTSQQSYSIDKSVNAWVSGGMSKAKVCAGMPFYGYLMNAPDMYGSITTTSGAKALSYNTISSSYLNNSGWQYTFDNNTKTPYLRNSAQTQVISFDDTTSTRMKCDYINAKGLAGAIIWKIAQSYNASAKLNPLLKTVGDFLLRNSAVSAVSSPDAAVPQDYILYQNYPNPFNPSTKIGYSLPSESHVKITVYNVLGSVVAELVNEVQPAGYREVSFNAENLSSGTYFCYMRASALDGSREVTSIKKTLLVK